MLNGVKKGISRKERRSLENQAFSSSPAATNFVVRSIIASANGVIPASTFLSSQLSAMFSKGTQSTCFSIVSRPLELTDAYLEQKRLLFLLENTEKIFYLQDSIDRFILKTPSEIESRNEGQR